MTYLYDGTDPNLPGTIPSYNGKISAVKWSSKYNGGSSNERSYIYKYDQLNQINQALYAERAPNSTATTAFNVNVHGFDETGITYDDDGNIKSLQRNYSSNNGSGGTALDNLTYTYDANNPDRLYQVSDAVSQTGSFGFNNIAGATTASYYQYDANGNLISDPYKGITISYNLLNLTDVISASNISNSSIKYTYGDEKVVIKKQVYKSGVLQATTDYIDEFVYTNGIISYLPMSEGRAVNVGGTFKPEYIITDQQGNARLSFQDNGAGTPVIMQENSYYAFGAVMPNSLVTAPTTPNLNMYNGGSEWQNAFQNIPDYYQTGSRNYDPEIGRFIGVDPLAELKPSLNNYHYASNNPIISNDPTGNCDNCDPPDGSTDEYTSTDGNGGQTDGGGEGNPSQTSVDGSVPQTSSSIGGTYNNDENVQELDNENQSTDLDGTKNPQSGTNSDGTPKQPGIYQNGVKLDDISQIINSKVGTITLEDGTVSTVLADVVVVATRSSSLSSNFGSSEGTDINSPDFHLGVQNLIWDRVDAGIEKGVVNLGAGQEVKILGKTPLVRGIARGAGFAAAGISLVTSVINKNGELSTGDVVKATIGVVSTLGPAGWIYTGLDVGSAFIFGKSITDAVGETVDKVLPNAKIKLY